MRIFQKRAKITNFIPTLHVVKSYIHSTMCMALDCGKEDLLKLEVDCSDSARFKNEKIDFTKIVKVQLTEYDDRQLLDVRVWVLKNEKDYIPAKKGISLRLEQVGALRDTIVKAAKEVESEK